MPVQLHHIVIDAHDLPRLGRFWAAALHWEVLSVKEREVVVGPSLDSPVGLCIMPSPDEKVGKNRVHLDLTCATEERDAEIERLIGLGATRAEIGQTGEESWVVMADPEGNEFCVVREKRDLVS